MEQLYQDVPDDLDPDRDESAAKYKAVCQIRRAIASKWGEMLLLAGGKARSEALQELQDFLSEMNVSYPELVQISPFPSSTDTENIEGPSTTASTSGDASQKSRAVASSAADREMAKFAWRYIECDGHCWGIMKASDEYGKVWGSLSHKSIYNDNLHTTVIIYIYIYVFILI